MFTTTKVCYAVRHSHHHLLVAIFSLHLISSSVIQSTMLRNRDPKLVKESKPSQSRPQAFQQPPTSTKTVPHCRHHFAPNPNKHVDNAISVEKLAPLPVYTFPSSLSPLNPSKLLQATKKFSIRHVVRLRSGFGGKGPLDRAS
jgi:hypothetical protein